MNIFAGDGARALPQRAKSPRGQEDADLAARAAWLHFVGGLTQAEVAERMGLSGTRAHRLIAKAQAMGLVRITVDDTAASCIELENALSERFDLTFCAVAMHLPEPGPIPLKSLGTVGGTWLDHILDTGQHKVIGVSHGRTIAAVVEGMRQRATGSTSFVSLLGGLTRSLAANPYDVIHRLAQKTGAESYLMPAPLYANSAHDKQVLLAQSMLGESFDRMRDASLAIVGVGDPAEVRGSAAHERAETDVGATGAVAEVLGQFLDVNGRAVETPFDGRTMALDLEELRGRDVVAIAGGPGKIKAIQATLQSGLLTGLIIDEDTARSLVERLGGREVAAAE